MSKLCVLLSMQVEEQNIQDTNVVYTHIGKYWRNTYNIIKRGCL